MPEPYAGGGYIKDNVARCWAYETAVLVEADRNLPEDIPRVRPFSLQHPSKSQCLPIIFNALAYKVLVGLAPDILQGALTLKSSQNRKWLPLSRKNAQTYGTLEIGRGLPGAPSTWV